VNGEAIDARTRSIKPLPSLCRGYTDVVDADLSKYFDSIPLAPASAAMSGA
jgi:hypothetical protein